MLYVWVDTGVNPGIFPRLTSLPLIELTVAPEPLGATTLLLPIRISTVSPTLRVALSISSNKKNEPPWISWTSNLDLVLYIQEFANTSLYVLSSAGFLIISPIFLTAISSPTSIKGISSSASKSDRTPVIRSSHFFSISPFSYPKIVSSALIGSVTLIASVTPVQPKNWLILFEVYSILLLPLTTKPVWPKPIVESTVITEAPGETDSKTLENPGTTKVPSTRSLSLYPTNKPSL